MDVLVDPNSEVKEAETQNTSTRASRETRGTREPGEPGKRERDTVRLCDLENQVVVGGRHTCFSWCMVG